MNLPFFTKTRRSTEAASRPAMRLFIPKDAAAIAVGAEPASGRVGRNEDADHGAATSRAMSSMAVLSRRATGSPSSIAEGPHEQRPRQ